VFYGVTDIVGNYGEFGGKNGGFESDGKVLLMGRSWKWLWRCQKDSDCWWKDGGKDCLGKDDKILRC